MKNFAWVYFIFGLLIILDSLLLLINGQRVWRASVIPEWNGWPGLVLGFAICVIALRVMLRHKNKREHSHITDEELAKAEAALDALYLREHGELPNKPKSGRAEDTQ